MKKLFLFDVDGTLAKSTCQLEPPMTELLHHLSELGDLGIVSGGAYEKLCWQTSEIRQQVRYIFSENGLVTYENGKCKERRNLRDVWDEMFIQRVVNFLLVRIAEMPLPYKRGTFVKFRNGMLYVTPIGGDCSAEERAAFAEYDETNHVREQLIKNILQEFRDENLDARLGGQIGIGVHPRGWDKSFALQFMNFDEFDEIHFFGDRCSPGGNDYPLYRLECPKWHSHAVSGPDDTARILRDIIRTQKSRGL